MEETTPLEEEVCPICQARLAPDRSKCSPCETRLTGARLHDPASFVWTSLALTACDMGVLWQVTFPDRFGWLPRAFFGLIPIYLAASNWDKLRQTRRTFLWLALGFLGYALLFTLLSMMPPTAIRLEPFIGYAVNLPIGFLLQRSQRPLYEAALKLGARPTSSLEGLVPGLGIALGALALTVGGLHAKYRLEIEQGARLVEQGDHSAAAAVFQRILRNHPKDPAAEYRLAWCHFQMRNWFEADRGFEQYLKADEKNAVALALLSRVRLIQGQSKESESLAARARAQDPQIFETLFGSDERE